MESIMSEERLFQSVTRGGFYLLTLDIINRTFDIIKLIILARLLVPNDFGLLGIALLTLTIFDAFSQLGIEVTLIQRKGNVDQYLNTVWTINIIRGIVLSGVIFIVSPLIANFFDAPEITSILKILAITHLLNGFRNIGIIYFRKELQFDKQFIYSIVASIADFVVSILAAFIIRNVWALLFGFLARHIIGLIASYIFHPYRPSIKVDWTKAKELFSFGKWVWGSGILAYLILHGDDIFVGKLLGATMLGFYQIAYKISNIPATEISHVISEVTFPAYSKLQDNIQRLRDAYLKVLQLVAFLSFLIGGLIFVLAKDFTKIFLGERWLPIVPVMRVLVFAGLLRSMASTSASIFYAVGNPKIDTTVQMVRLSILAALIYPFTIKWGIMGASIAVLLSIFIANVGACLMAIKITKCSLRHFTKIIILPLINISTGVIVILKLKTLLNTGVWEFGVLVLAGILLYIIVTFLQDKFFNYGMKSIVKDTIRSFKMAHKWEENSGYP